MSFFSKVSRVFDAIVTSLRNVSLYALIVGGLIVVGMAIGYSFLVPGKPLAILVASVGSIVGTAMICTVIPKIRLLKGEEEQSELVKMRAENEELRSALLKGEEEQSELVKMRAENEELRSALAKECSDRKELADRLTNLDEETERLKRMKVQVNSITRILKLALLQFEGSLTDFCRRRLGKPQDGWLSSKREEYVGVYQIDFRGNIGVDLQKVRVRQDEDGNRLFVSGLKPEFMGFEKYTDTPLLNEVRSFKERRLLRRDVAEIETKDRRVLSLAERQRLEVKQRLEQGVACRSYEEAVRRLAQEWLLCILEPLGWEIKFIETDDASGKPLMLFLEDHNRKLDAQIDGLKQERRLLISGQPSPAPADSLVAGSPSGEA